MTRTHVDADVLVVGAGMAGLTAAKELAGAGMTVTVVDKGRAVGGRMATRRIGDARFDHGAQHFSARSSVFAGVVASWIDEQVASVWYEGRSITQPDRGREPRHIGTDGMRGIPSHLARRLDVRTATRVTEVRVDDDVVRVETGTGVLRTRSCIVTAPIPQLVDLVDLSADPVLRDELAAISYDPCLAMMAVLDEPSGLDAGHAAFSAGPIAWIADNHHKGISAVPAVTIHSSVAFALEHLEAEQEAWVPTLLAAAAPHLGGAVIDAVAHRWRYSQPRSTRVDGSKVVPGAAPIVLAGEVFAGAKVEGAHLSGISAAQRVLDLSS